MKSRNKALGYCFLLGFLGIHRFYLGYTLIGIIQFLTGGGFVIWALVDFLRLFTGSLGPVAIGWNGKMRYGWREEALKERIEEEKVEKEEEKVEKEEEEERRKREEEEKEERRRRERIPRVCRGEEGDWGKSYQDGDCRPSIPRRTAHRSTPQPRSSQAPDSRGSPSWRRQACRGR